MDELRIKCNKARGEVGGKSGGRRENKEGQQARLDGPSGQKVWGGGVLH